MLLVIHILYPTISLHFEDAFVGAEIYFESIPLIVGQNKQCDIRLSTFYYFLAFCFPSLVVGAIPPIQTHLLLARCLISKR